MDKITSNESIENSVFYKNQRRYDYDDLRFDRSLSISEEKLDHLTIELEKIFPHNERRRNAAERERHRRRMGAIFSNGIQGQQHVAPIYYPRGSCSFRGDTPAYFSAYTFPKGIDALAKAGLVFNEVAEPSQHGGSQSTYSLLPSGLQLLGGLDITASDLIIVKEDHRFVEIRDAYGCPMRLDRSNPTIASLIYDQEKINEFISGHEISYIKNSAGPWVSQTYCVPFKTLGTRIFNGSLAYCGRQFRCFWHNIRREERKTTFIDSHPTSEYDYGSMFIRMAYHSKGLEAPHDPYDIPALRRICEEQGRDYVKVRGPVKRLMQTGINCPKTMPFRNWRFAGLEGVYIKDAHRMIWEANEPIQEFVFSDYGRIFMKWESDILTDIQLAGVRDEIPVLGIHDSFMVRNCDKDWIQFHMKESYKKYPYLRDYEPIIKLS